MGEGEEGREGGRGGGREGGRGYRVGGFLILTEEEEGERGSKDHNIMNEGGREGGREGGPDGCVRS